MIELQQDQYASTVLLFAPMQHHLAIAAALTGCAEGRVFADTAQNPRSALVWVGHRLYFGGDPENAAFNSELGEWLTVEVFPSAQAGVFTLYSGGEGWQRAIETEILGGHPPISATREYYELDLQGTSAPQDANLRARVSPSIEAVNQSSEGAGTGASSETEGELPQGFILRVVDPSLVETTGLEHLDDLLEEMQSERPSVEDFLRRSFGMVIIDTTANRLVTWCLSEYNCGDGCEVGIATMEGYQRRGLATITGRAFAEQARAAGIHRIGWHCWKDNLPSAATARALSYQKAAEDTGYFIFADSVLNLAVHGDVQLNHGDYAGAIEWFERAFQRGGGAGMAWAYVRAGCAAARLGDSERAFCYLDQAVDFGYPNKNHLLSVDHLESLRGLPAWSALMERMAT